MTNKTELPDLDRLEELADEDIEEIAVDYYRAMTDSIDDVIGFGRAVERAVLARRAQPEGEVIPGKHAVFPINLLGNPMREYNHGKWESAIWPSNQTEGEAPQADWQAYALNLHAVMERGYKSLASAAMCQTRDGEAAWYAMGEALAVMPPAAQHAETGALEAELKRRMATYAAGHEAAVEYLRSELEKARAALAAQSQSAHSAPGTPEAPADIEKALRELMSIVRIHSDAMDTNFAWAELQYAEEVLRAAQLQGGQEGSESNG